MPMDASNYGDVIADLLAESRLNELGPGQPNRKARTQLDTLKPETLVPGRSPGDRDMALACIAGLWLYHDLLDDSHLVSQNLSTAEGSFWHGIMHRREPDYSNSKYWFRRVGDHEIFPQLLQAGASVIEGSGTPRPIVQLLKNDRWDPYAFVDCCAEHYGQGGAGEQACKRLQQIEWECLFSYCFDHAYA